MVWPRLCDAARLESGGDVLRRGVGGRQRAPHIRRAPLARLAARRARHGVQRQVDRFSGHHWRGSWKSTEDFEYLLFKSVLPDILMTLFLDRPNPKVVC